MPRQNQLVLQLLALCVCLVVLTIAVSCGGGGGTNPALPQSPAVDDSLINASFDTNTLVLTIQGAAGAVEVGASVFVRDGDNNTAWALADTLGAFSITNFPVGFITTPGTSLAVTQSSPGHSEGPASNVVIVGV